MGCPYMAGGREAVKGAALHIACVQQNSLCPCSQLRSEVGCLQTDLSGKRAEMETLNTLLQRREREGQEGGNLVKMLTEDLRTAKEES